MTGDARSASGSRRRTPPPPTSAAGVRPGDVVAITLPPSDYAIAYAAVVRAGAVAAGLNTRLGPREVGAIVERSQPAVVISEPPWATLVLPR